MRNLTKSLPCLAGALAALSWVPGNLAGPLALGTGRFEDGAMSYAGVHLALAAVGREGEMRDVGTASAWAAEGEIRVRRAPGVTEWWRSVRAALEHGVTIDAAPAGAGPLVLELSVGSGVTPAGDGTITLEGPATRATYSALSVIDARGALVPARMAAVGERIRIIVDDRGAGYPLVVDPLLAVEEARLRNPTASRPVHVALSADGAWGATASGSNAAIFQRTGLSWTRVFDTPMDSGPASLTADGTRALFGRYVWARSGTTWAVEATLVTTGDTRISADGARIVVLGAGATSFGLTQVLVRSGSTWTEEAVLPVASFDGRAFAISADGSRVAVAQMDLVSVFARTGTTWSLEQPLSFPSYVDSVAMSGDGAYLMAASQDGEPASLYARSGSTWSLQTTFPQPSGGPIDTPFALDGVGRRALVGNSLYVRRGVTWSHALDLPFAASSLGGHGSTALSASGTRALMGSESLSEAFVYRLYDDGDPCTVDAECSSGFCRDSVCCATDCGASATDCEACSTAAGALADGACGALSAVAAPTTTCRPATGPCDVAEVCSSASRTCPMDAIVPNGGAVCRPPAGACDVAEVCNGSGVACPVDLVAPAATCRPAAGPCDVAESCNGASAGCPADALLPAGSVCQPTTGDPCDLDDICSGTSACPARFAAATVPCGDPISGGDCDAPDHCSGTSGDCVGEFFSGVECRTSAGGCDSAEVCLGDSADCPPDLVEPVGMACRISTNPSCDPAEVCDGVAASCPADVTSCVPLADSGPRSDGGSGTDGASGPAPVSGCACRSAASDISPSTHLISMLLAVVVVGRRAAASRRREGG